MCSNWIDSTSFLSFSLLSHRLSRWNTNEMFASSFISNNFRNNWLSWVYLTKIYWQYHTYFKTKNKYYLKLILFIFFHCNEKCTLLINLIITASNIKGTLMEFSRILRIYYRTYQGFSTKRNWIFILQSRNLQFAYSGYPYFRHTVDKSFCDIFWHIRYF